MISIEFLDKSQKEKYLPLLFSLLHANMSKIAPTGNTFEEGYASWYKAVYPALERPERQILLLNDNDKLAGFFQYGVSSSTFVMEEIQFERAYWGTGLFRALYTYLSEIIPENIAFVEANADKRNIKSQNILKHLGLEIIGENKNGISYCFRGDCRQMLDKYRRGR